MHLSHNKIGTLVATPVALLCLAGAANAQAVMYNDSASFLANLAPGFYLENFNTVVGTFSSKSFSSNGFSYTVSAPGNLIPVNGAISTVNKNDSISIVFSGAPVSAVGGNFFDTNLSGNYILGGITVHLSDGTNSTFAPTSASQFEGFTTASGSIMSLSIQAIQTSVDTFPTLDNFYVGGFSGAPQGGTVPEPGSLAQLAGFGIVGAGFALKRRKK